MQPRQTIDHFQIQESITWKVELCLKTPEEGKLTVVCNFFIALYYSPPHLGFCIQPDDGYI